TPGPLFEPMKFAGFMSFQVKHAMYGHSIVFTGYRGYEYNFTAALFYGIGAALLALSIIGILMTFVRRDKNMYPAAVFSLIYYLASANSKVLCVRYFLLVYPALAICAAYGVWAEYKALKLKSLRAAWGVLCICGVAWTCFYVCALNNLFCKAPTEKSASDYIYRTIPAGTELAMPYPWSYYPVFSNGFRGEKSDFVTVTPRPVEFTFKYLWSFDYFPKDPEWVEIILARSDAPKYAVFSDYDTVDPLRLRNNKRCPAGWRKTVEHRCGELDALKENYTLMKEFKHKLDFMGVEIFDIKNLPHDMKYPDSEISIYRHR
ncbi:MAG: hypothetical protein IJT09_01735, partial [Abditibacteriota bacterium]|nr:hypothetical protein [Abditibacteriota bacterium]